MTSAKTQIHVLIYFQEQFMSTATPFILNQNHSACDKLNTFNWHLIEHLINMASRQIVSAQEMLNG